VNGSNGNQGIKVGLFLASYFPVDSKLEDELDRITNQAAMAERLGFGSLFLGHHYLSSGAFLQPIPTLSYLAAITERIHLGLGVHLVSLQKSSSARRVGLELIHPGRYQLQPCQ
jgi:alkanesulfonate monooxygenase SsuD/methylene tetrahydromethanopterin reductase-like flavin-dependent oxidoreductase (luciferase family)